MWCNEVQEGLPLLEPDDPEAEELLAHAEECPACREQLSAYRADERALSALRAQRGPAPLAGFADGVMARLAQPGPAAPLPRPLELIGAEPAPTPRAPLPLGREPRGELLSLGASLPTLLALAAAVMVTVGLLITAPGAPLPVQRPAGVAAGQPARVPEPALAVSPAPEPREAAPLLAHEPLPAPARVERDPAPMPRRVVGGERGGRRGMDVVPVDRGSTPGMSGMRPEDLPPELRRMLERALPGLQRLLPPPPRPEKRPDEVRF